MLCLWYFTDLKVFEGTGEITQLSITSNSDVRHWEKGEILHFQGAEKPAVHIVLSGRVELAHFTEDGRRIILGYLREGGLLGLQFGADADAAGAQSMLDCHQATAADPTETMVFDREYFDSLLERRPRVAVNILRVFGLQTRRLELRLLGLMYRSNIGKLAALLDQLAEDHSEEKDGAWHLRLALTHEELGNMIGLTREQVSRLLAELEHRGLLQYARRKIVLLDREGLREVG
jgi:CRP/FNR family cyclic AMP-dependent transcriptional regulator